ncbi:ABC transporter permease subunit [Desulfatiglans anilini]|uniref:ABC transporter permease subunit n=1 Tax=Desulfatiglans anilini TaxID=90728 RepID=UPI0004118B0E|nr:ABC transporter permease subunit [Desulfatiglans anilini]
MSGALQNTWTVARRELGGYFGAPVAYVFIIIFLLLTGFFTFSVGRFYEMGQADLAPFFLWHPWIFLFLVPAVAMRLWAEEWRTGTIELLMTLPVSIPQIVLGKFLAAWLFIAIALFLTFPLVLTVAYLGDPDLGAVACGYAGSLLMAGAYIGIGGMTSSLTRNQVISFIVSLVICLFLVLAGWPPVTGMLAGWAPAWLVDTVSGLSFMPHFMAMQRGILDVRDVIYFFSVIFFMLSATGVILRNRRAF